jgi:hypothetical protein
MTRKQYARDLAVRALLLVIYLTTTSFIQWTQPHVIGVMIELAAQSLLNAAYCFEYKTAAASIDTPIAYGLFEKQWVYQLGFGFPITLGLFLTKHLGSSIFFLVFPLMTVMSMDEQGYGLIVIREDRNALFKLPCFTWVVDVKNTIFGAVAQRIKIE